MRVDTTFCQLIAGFQIHAIHLTDTGTIRYQIGLGFSGLLVGHHDLALLLCIL